jgi:hypothetical protein
VSSSHAAQRTGYAALHVKATSEESKRRLSQNYDLLGIVIADLNPRFPFGIPLASPEMSQVPLASEGVNVTASY